MPDPTFSIKPTVDIAKIRASHTPVFGLWAGLLLFFLTVAAYGGFTLLNRAQERARLELLAQIDLKREELNPELIGQLTSLDKRLKNLNTLLSSHSFPSRALTWIEQKTFATVFFPSFTFSGDQRRVDLAGETVSISLLNQQLNLLQREPDVEKMDFGGLSIGKDGAVSFKLTLFFKPSFIQLSE